MGFDLNQITQSGMLDSVLSMLPYPLDKEDVLAQAEQMGANQQIVGAMRQALPDKTFNSAEDIKQAINRQQRH